MSKTQEEIVKEWLDSNEFAYSDNVEDLEFVCLDGRFNIKELISKIVQADRQSLVEELVTKINQLKKPSLWNKDSKRMPDIPDFYNQALSDIIALIKG